ncbi:MAG: alginate export family protein [Terracidiphilus sp.]
MFSINRVAGSIAAMLIVTAVAHCPAQSAQSSDSSVSVFANERVRVDAWQWFAAPPNSNSYGYVESLLRLGIAQHIHRWDWQLELAQPALFDLPSNAISPVAAQGQLGLGGTYYAAGVNSYPAAAFFKQGFARYHFGEKGKDLRLGRIEFFEGMETQPKNTTIKWLQVNRIQQRLIGNFGFTNAQRSFDGADAHFGAGDWNITAAAGRADQGVFNMNGNPELNVDFQYLALTRSDWKQHLLWRAFGAGYHDGRTGLTKTDNRALAVRATDHENIRIGTYGGDLLAAIPAGPGQFDFLFWGALQNGRWGSQSDSANAVAVEGGYQIGKQSRAPWLRGGWFRSSGDNNATDGTHNTFFQMLPTPRVYARMPFYNLMNNTDEFVQLIDKPAKNLALRSDLHWIQLTSAHDLWYQGGGAFDNKVFGFVGRPANGFSSLASVPDISADWRASKDLNVTFYYAYSQGKSVVAAIYPTDHNAQFGCVELNYHWGIEQKASAK